MRYIALAIMLFLIAPSTVQANDSEWFAALKASLSSATMDQVSHHATIGTGTIIDNELDGQIRDTETHDYSTGVGFSVGKRIGNWTFEGEYFYRYRTDWDVVTTTPSIQTITNVFSDVETHTVLLNIVRRGAISQHWSWEVGAGIGLVANNIAASYIERATATVPEIKFNNDVSETSFTYNALAGVSHDLGGRWTLNIRYRYIDLGELSTGLLPQRAARVSADLAAHEIQFGLEMEL